MGKIINLIFFFFFCFSGAYTRRGVYAKRMRNRPDNRDMSDTLVEILVFQLYNTRLTRRSTICHTKRVHTGSTTKYIIKCRIVNKLKELDIRMRCHVIGEKVHKSTWCWSNQPEVYPSTSPNFLQLPSTSLNFPQLPSTSLNFPQLPPTSPNLWAQCTEYF